MGMMKKKMMGYKSGGMTKGGQALFDAMKAKGYKEDGGEKLLMKMTKGGMLDMMDMVVSKYGSEKKKSMKKSMYKTGGYKNY